MEKGLETHPQPSRDLRHTLYLPTPQKIVAYYSSLEELAIMGAMPMPQP